MITEYATFDPKSIPFPPGIANPLFVTIPCYAEENSTAVLSSLDNCSPCGKEVVVILLINSPENASERVLELNMQSYLSARESEFRNINTVPIWIKDIPLRIAGVGLARRLAMNLAAQWYVESGHPEHPILCCDADCEVQDNYTQALDRFFIKNQRLDAASVYFEHPVEKQKDPLLRKAIVDYETHLRYLIVGQKWAGHPQAFHTVGSSMAARAGSYLRQGGMNKRKAGEDFYFLHKFSKVGRLANCAETTVFPSPRISDRVPFGTGRALLDISEGRIWDTWAPETIFDLKVAVDVLKSSFHRSENELLHACPDSFRSFCKLSDFAENLKRVKSNAASEETFAKGIFHWFDAFRLMKYAHHCRDHYYPNQPVSKAVKAFFFQAFQMDLNGTNPDTLKAIRDFERNSH